MNGLDAAKRIRDITKIEKDVVYIGDISIPISRQKKKEFKENFLKYIERTD